MNTSRPLTIAEADRIRRAHKLRHAGHGVATIANRMGVGYQEAVDLLRQTVIAPPPVVSEIDALRAEVAALKAELANARRPARVPRKKQSAGDLLRAQIKRLARKGMSDGEIAEQLGVSRRTVELTLAGAS